MGNLFIQNLGDLVDSLVFLIRPANGNITFPVWEKDGRGISCICNAEVQYGTSYVQDETKSKPNIAVIDTAVELILK